MKEFRHGAIVIDDPIKFAVDDKAGRALAAASFRRTMARCAAASTATLVITSHPTKADSKGLP
jgi:hypothetical protein